jgi:hypothetical protein
MTYSFIVDVRNVGQAPVTGAIMVASPYACPGRVGPNLLFAGSNNLLFAGSNFAPGARHVTDPFGVTLGTESGGTCTFTLNRRP